MKKLSAAALLTLLIIGMFPVMLTGITNIVNMGVSKNSYLPSYSEHVPILIDGTEEFELQGYSGSGTVGDPYIISGLNITTYSSIFAIEIRDTQAYFIIQNCFIWQRYSTSSIYLENITHGVVEDSQIVSVSTGLRVDTGNNTEVSNVKIESTGSAFYGTQSYDVYLHDCDFTSSNNHAISVSTYDGLQIENCDVRGGGSSDGIRISTSDNIQVTNVHCYSGGDAGLYISASDHVAINGFESSTGDIGVYFLDVSNGTVEQCKISNTGDYGIYLDGGADNVIDSNSILNGDGYAILVDSSDYLDITSNYIRDSADQAIYLDTGTEVDVEQNTIRDCGSYAIDINGCENITVYQNNIYDSYYGVSTESSTGIDIDGNTIDTCENYGVYAYTTPMVSIVNNHISNVGSRGIHVSGCSNPSVVANQIYGANEGIRLFTSEPAVVEANTIEARQMGIGLNQLHVALVENNLITAHDQGIYLYQTSFCDFLDNVLNGAGWEITAGSIDYHNHTFSGNTVNSKPFGYFVDDEESTIYASNYGQMLLLDCNGTDIFGEATFTDATMGIIVAYSVAISISDITTVDTKYGIVVRSSPNTTIQSYTSTGSDEYAIRVDNSPYLMIDGADFETPVTADSIYINNCPDSTLTNLNVNHGYYGVEMYNSPRTLILDSEFTNQAYMGLYMINSAFLVVENNYFMNCTQGAIYGEYIDWTVINNNEIHHAYRGVVVLYCDDINITLNYITHANWGVGISQVDLSFILNNTVLWNNYGIYIELSTSDEVYYNIIGPNTNNGYDGQGAVHYWDDGVALGNWWSDWTGGPYYSVPGGGGRDRYPQTYNPDEPLIDSPMDVYYAEGTTGNTLTWQVFDEDLKDWSVTMDSQAYDSGIWESGNTVTVDIDGFAYGTYTFDVTVEDVYGHTATDQVLVIVYDGTPPTIDHPLDKVAIAEGTGQAIIWTPSDLHPASYIIYQDGNEVDSGTWNGGSVSASIDGLTTGMKYVYKVVVYDIDDNTATDSVIVTVKSDTTAPTLNSPADFNYTVGQISNYIEWVGNDANPRWYRVQMDDEVYEEGPWGGWALSINVDGLDVGTYEFQLTIFDLGNLDATDSVTVTVLPVGYIAPAGPIPIELILLILGVVGAVVVIVVIVHFVRKRRASF